jgi:regulator of replication initiation timing
MDKKNILAEAIADSKSLKKAALANAQNLILESMKKDLREMVEDQMNEAADETEEEECEEEEEEVNEGAQMNIKETEDADMDDLAGDFDAGEEEEEGGEDEFDGLSESDLNEAIRAALQEVDHGKMGDVRIVDPDNHPDPITGADKKEDGWENKEAPESKDWTVKEGKMKNRIAKLVTENTILRKTNEKLKKAVNEVHLFNTKLHYAHKLLSRDGMTHNLKVAIAEKMDAVKSTREAKALYESFDLAFRALGESKTAAKKSTSLSESLGIRKSAQGKNVSETLNESVQADDQFDPYSKTRMQALAGIKK